MKIIKLVYDMKWASPVVVVKKNDDTVILCGDYRALNSRLILDYYSLQNIQELFDNIPASTSYFAKLDMNNAYLQMILEEKSQELTTIALYSGIYCYTRAPFGIATAPAAFQRMVHRILGKEEGMLNYLDDILIVAHSEDQLVKRLNRTLEKLNRHNIKLNDKKCIFKSREVVWLGVKTNKEGLAPDPDKLLPLLKMESPEEEKTLKAFLGSVNYYKRFTSNFAKTEIAYLKC